MRSDSQFLWGPPISQGTYLESQRVLWPPNGTTVGDVQTWQMPMSPARTQPHSPIQGLVVRPAGTGRKVVALRWLVDRAGRPGWLVHGVVVPSTMTTIEAMSLAQGLKLDDARVESIYKGRTTPPEPTSVAQPIAPDDLDCGVVEAIRRAVLGHNLPLAVSGPTEPRIRTHIAAALATLPRDVAGSTTVSTLESRPGTGFDIVGVIEPLWSGGRPPAEGFAGVARIGDRRPTPRWLRGALGSPALMVYLQTAPAEQLAARESEIAAFFAGEGLPRVVHALLRKQETELLQRHGVDVGSELEHALDAGETWALDYLSTPGVLSQRLAQRLARTRDRLPDRALLDAVDRMNPQASHVFWKLVMQSSSTRRELHPGCTSRDCQVVKTFDERLGHDADWEAVLRTHPHLVPLGMLAPEAVIPAVLTGQASQIDATFILDRPDVAALCSGAILEATARGVDQAAVAGGLLELLARRPDVEQHAHATLLRNPATYGFAAGPYLDALVERARGQDPRSLILNRLFAPGSLAQARLEVSPETTLYLRGTAPAPAATQRVLGHADRASTKADVGGGDATHDLRRIGPIVAVAAITVAAITGAGFVVFDREPAPRKAPVTTTPPSPAPTEPSATGEPRPEAAGTYPSWVAPMVSPSDQGSTP